MKPRKLFSVQKFLTTLHVRAHSFSSLPLSQTLRSTITPQSLQNSVLSSEWHFIKHLSSTLTPSLISSILPTLRFSPHLIPNFLDQLHPQSLNTECYCLAITIVSRQPSPKPALDLIKKVISHNNIGTKKEFFDGLLSAREELNVSSSIVFDLFVRSFCELKKADQAFECFYLMKEKGVLPKIETCNQLLSLFLKLNRTDAASVLYAEMFRLKINSTVYRFNVMINVLCKEGKLKKAEEFAGHMEGLGF